MPSPNVSLAAAEASLISCSVNECHGDNTVGAACTVSWALWPQLVRATTLKVAANRKNLILLFPYLFYFVEIKVTASFRYLVSSDPQGDESTQLRQTSTALLAEVIEITLCSFKGAQTVNTRINDIVLTQKKLYIGGHEKCINA
jgi:hypothetical protein